jgi:hypothetical protein
MLRTICDVYVQFPFLVIKTKSLRLKRQMFRMIPDLDVQILTCTENSPIGRLKRQIGRKILNLDRTSANCTLRERNGRKSVELRLNSFELRVPLRFRSLQRKDAYRSMQVIKNFGRWAEEPRYGQNDLDGGVAKNYDQTQESRLKNSPSGPQSAQLMKIR